AFSAAPESASKGPVALRQSPGVSEVSSRASPIYRRTMTSLAGGSRAGVQYAGELYLPRFRNDALPEGKDRVRAAADEMTREGTSIRFLRSLFVPGDEICLLLLDGPSREAVAEVARRAGIAFERVLEVEVAADEGSERAIEQGGLS